MSQELTHAQTSLSEWSQERKQLFKNALGRDLTDAEAEFAIMQSQRTRLDPFKKQIYFTKLGGKMVTQVSIEGLRSIAQRSGNYDGSDIEWCGEDGVWKDVWLSDKPPAAARATVHKKNGRSVSRVAKWSEFYNANNSMWKKFPTVMVGKCAEANALRSAFSDDLAGLYEESEIHHADVADENKRAVQEQLGRLNGLVAKPAMLENVQVGHTTGYVAHETIQTETVVPVVASTQEPVVVANAPGTSEVSKSVREGQAGVRKNTEARRKAEANAKTPAVVVEKLKEMGAELTYESLDRNWNPDSEHDRRLLSDIADELKIPNDWRKTNWPTLREELAKLPLDKSVIKNQVNTIYSLGYAP